MDTATSTIWRCRSRPSRLWAPTGPRSSTRRRWRGWPLHSWRCRSALRSSSGPCWWCRLVAPGGGPARAAHLALFIGLFPTAFGLMVGQPVVLVAAAVGAAWWLAERDRPVLAGVALSAMALKPQLALLVPLCLLVAGHRRMFVGWLVASAMLVAVALALLGPEGLQRYRDALSLATQWEPTRRYAIAGPLGLGP